MYFDFVIRFIEFIRILYQGKQWINLRSYETPFLSFFIIVL